jgi:hypothetical protein
MLAITPTLMVDFVGAAAVPLLPPPVPLLPPAVVPVVDPELLLLLLPHAVAAKASAAITAAAPTNRQPEILTLFSPRKTTALERLLRSGG